jgi:hypothetical protein
MSCFFIFFIFLVPFGTELGIDRFQFLGTRITRIPEEPNRSVSGTRMPRVTRERSDTPLVRIGCDLGYLLSPNQSVDVDVDVDAKEIGQDRCPNLWVAPCHTLLVRGRRSHRDLRYGYARAARQRPWCQTHGIDVSAVDTTTFVACVNINLLLLDTCSTNITIARQGAAPLIHDALLVILSSTEKRDR